MMVRNCMSTSAAGVPYSVTALLRGSPGRRLVSFLGLAAPRDEFKSESPRTFDPIILTQSRPSGPVRWLSGHAIGRVCNGRPSSTRAGTQHAERCCAFGCEGEARPRYDPDEPS